MVLIEQGVPALYLLILVLEALVPVFQTLAFGCDAQLAATYHHDSGEDRSRGERKEG